LIAVLAVSGDLLLAQPQQITVHGVVTNQSGEPLSGARVTITFAGGGAELPPGYTNEVGEYRFETVARANGRVEAERSGYIKNGRRMLAALAAPDQERLNLEIILSPEPQRIAEGALPVQPVTSEEAAGVEAMLGEGPPWVRWVLGLVLLSMAGVIAWLVGQQIKMNKFQERLWQDAQRATRKYDALQDKYKGADDRHQGLRLIVNEHAAALKAAAGDGRKSVDDRVNRPQGSQSFHSAPPNPAEDIAKAYQVAFDEKNSIPAFMTEHPGTRYLVSNASDRNRQEKSKQPAPEYVEDPSGEYYLMTKGKSTYVVPWFRPIDTHLMDGGALDKIYDCFGYDRNRRQRAIFRRAATIEMNGSHWKVTAKGVVSFDGGA
jgi:hypothetical protein